MTIHRAKQLREEKGFTLIELLIVIVVLGILAGIAVFAVQQFSDDASDFACDEQATNLETAAAAWADRFERDADEYVQACS